MKFLVFATAVLGLVLTTTGCDDRGRNYGGGAYGSYYAPGPPPPPRIESYGAPRQGHVWVGGYWGYSNRRYNWVEGNWARPPHARAGWYPGGWQSSRRGWMYRPGRWR